MDKVFLTVSSNKRAFSLLGLESFWLNCFVPAESISVVLFFTSCCRCRVNFEVFTFKDSAILCGSCFMDSAF